MSSLYTFDRYIQHLKYESSVCFWKHSYHSEILKITFKQVVCEVRERYSASRKVSTMNNATMNNKTILCFICIFTKLYSYQGICECQIKFWCGVYLQTDYFTWQIYMILLIYMIRTPLNKAFIECKSADPFGFQFIIFLQLLQII